MYGRNKVDHFIKKEYLYDTNEPIYETEAETLRIDRWLPRGKGVGEAQIGSLGLTDANWYI